MCGTQRHNTHHGVRRRNVGRIESRHRDHRKRKAAKRFAACGYNANKRTNTHAYIDHRILGRRRRRCRCTKWNDTSDRATRNQNHSQTKKRSFVCVRRANRNGFFIIVHKPRHIFDQHHHHHQLVVVASRCRFATHISEWFASETSIDIATESILTQYRIPTTFV